MLSVVSFLMLVLLGHAMMVAQRMTCQLLGFF
jgi:hypothetical protein